MEREVYPGVIGKWVWSSFIEEYMAPDPHKIALEIAKQKGWELWHTEGVAANYFGVSTQLVARYVYVSSGPSEIIELNYGKEKNPKIEFINKAEYAEYGDLSGCGKIDLYNNKWLNFEELKNYYENKRVELEQTQ